MIRTEQKGSARWIVLDRPEIRNALSAQLMTHACTALEEAVRDPQVRSIVITGAGKAFSAGADLNEMKAMRGSRPIQRANWAERSAIAAYCSAVGRSVTAVSAIRTVWWRATTTLMPKGVAPGSSSMTIRICRSDWLKGRVVPVIIASASPRASMAAAK